MAEAGENKLGQPTKGKERLIFLAAIILEGVLILFFFNGYLAAKKKNINLSLDLKKVQEELAQKEKDLSTQLTGLRATENELKDKLKELESTKADLEGKLNDAKALGEEMMGHLEAAKKDKEEFFKKVMKETRKTELTLLAKLEMANKENLELQNKLFKLTVLGANPEAGPGSSISQSTSTDVDLEKIVVKSKEAETTEGKVVKVDAKYGFIIFDLGEGQGIKAGSVADIYRGKMKISEVAVNEVYPTMSFGTVVKEKTIRKVDTGDRVVATLPPLPAAP